MSGAKSKEIMCEDDGGPVLYGKCWQNMWCTGPYQLKYAMCGVEELCEPGTFYIWNIVI